MNHLAHFQVAHPDPHLMIGGLLGDFVKGRLTGQLPCALERGIQLHRAVDAFSDRHEVTKQSVARFAPEFRRYGPIMVDVIYDYFLAQRWEEFCDGTLDDFCDRVFEVLESADAQSSEIPERARNVARRMATSQSLLGYGQEQYVERSLANIGVRLTRDNPLDLGFAEFRQHRTGLSDDFEQFFPELQAFCMQWQQEHPQSEPLTRNRKDP